MKSILAFLLAVCVTSSAGAATKVRAKAKAKAKPKPAAAAPAAPVPAESAPTLAAPSVEAAPPPAPASNTPAASGPAPAAASPSSSATTAQTAGATDAATPGAGAEQITAAKSDAAATGAPSAPADGVGNEVSEVSSATDAAATGALGVAVAPKLGAVVPTSDLGPTYFLGLDVSYRPPELGGWLGFALDVGFAKPKTDGSIDDAALGGVDYDLSQRLFMLTAEVFATLPLAPVELYGGLGYGVYLLHAQVKALGQTNDETQARSGMQLRAGAALPLGPGAAFAELRYHYVGLEFLSTGEANAGGITVAAGYRFAF